MELSFLDSILELPCSTQIKSRITMGKEAFNNNNNNMKIKLLCGKLNLDLRRGINTMFYWKVSPWALRKMGMDKLRHAKCRLIVK